MGLYIIGGVPMHIGSSDWNEPIKNKNRIEKRNVNSNRRRIMDMGWLLRKVKIRNLIDDLPSGLPEDFKTARKKYIDEYKKEKGISSGQEFIYEVCYMVEKEIYLAGVGTALKFVFEPIFTLNTPEEAESKVHYLNGGS